PLPFISPSDNLSSSPELLRRGVETHASISARFPVLNLSNRTVHRTDALLRTENEEQRTDFMPAFKFSGVDFIQFDSLLSDEERMVRDTARQFIEDNLIPIIEQCNRDGRFPRELVKPMGDLGFFGANLKGYGCAEMSNVEYG